jgi:hypothetical protein
LDRRLSLLGRDSPPWAGRERFMICLFSFGLLCLLVVGQGRAAEDLAGTWRQETEGVGVSYWEFTPKGEHAYDAQEYGLASVHGIARLEDGVLVILNPRPLSSLPFR